MDTEWTLLVCKVSATLPVVTNTLQGACTMPASNLFEVMLPADMCPRAAHAAVVASQLQG